MKNKIIFLMAMFSFLLFLGTSQVYGDSMVYDIDPPDGFTTSNNTDYSDDSNPDLFNPDNPASEEAWLEALLADIDVDYLGKDENTWNDGNWSAQGPAVPWTYAVLKFGQGQTGFDHLAIIDDDYNDIVEDWALNYSTQGLSHMTYFGGQSVPEPATMILLGTCIIGLSCLGRKKIKK